MDKQDAIEKLGFGVLNKVVMLFPTVFWDDHLDYVWFIVDSLHVLIEIIVFSLHILVIKQRIEDGITSFGIFIDACVLL
jgi:hypothetical protein